MGSQPNINVLVFRQPLKSWWRLLRVSEHLLTGVTIILGVALGRHFGLRAVWLPEVVRWWHARLCRALGVHMQVTGELVPNALLVANHVSWLDIPVLGSQARIDFLSKSDIKAWPLIGWMAEIVGTLFIVRGANQTDVLIPEIGERVQRGRHVVIFPEGTTTDGSRLHRFHPRLLAAGQLEGVLIQPVALRYGSNPAPDPVVPFIGNDVLLPHLMRLARHPGLQVHIRVLPPLDGSALSRRHISEYCRHSIGEALGLETVDARSPPADQKAAQQPVSSTTPFVETT